jgi:hypothetical protein
VHLASRAYQVESSDGAASMQGVEFAAQGAETAEECAGTTDTVVAGTDTAALLTVASYRASWTERGSRR